jgi:hypothetical protein
LAWIASLKLKFDVEQIRLNIVGLFLLLKVRRDDALVAPRFFLNFRFGCFGGDLVRQCGFFLGM